MNRTSVIGLLSTLIVVLALIASGAGLAWEFFQPGEGAPFAFTTVHGETVQIYGRGLYRYDSLFTGAGFKAQDTVTLIIGVPLLVVASLLYRRGSLRGSVLLLGALGYMLYVYASMAFGAAYNSLFLLYIGLFAASLFAFVLVFTQIDRQNLGRFVARLPRRTLAGFLFISGLLTLTVWLLPLVTALRRGLPPDLLGGYTTVITDVLDLGVIVPSLFLAGWLVLRRDPLGYLIAAPLLMLIVLLLPMIVLGTVNQVAAGIVFTIGEVVGPIAGFLLLGVVACWLLINLLRKLGAVGSRGSVATGDHTG